MADGQSERTGGNPRVRRPGEVDEVDRPRVTVKLAQTLDGRIATATGHSQWISGEESLQLAHELRAEHDAVLVGIGTVLRDDPRLTVRLVDGPNPLRVLLDTSLRTPLSSRVLAEEPTNTLIFAGEGVSTDRIAAVERLGARLLIVSRRAVGGLDLAEVLFALAHLGVGSVLVEGGASVVTSLLRERLVDRMVVCVASKLMGAGLEGIGDLGIRDLADALTLEDVTVRRCGPDVVFDGRLSRTADAEGRNPRAIARLH